MRSLPPQLSFADLELQFQGVQLDPSLRAISEFLDQHVVKAAVHLGLEDGKTLRVDTTVVESNIHYPTDATLLWDSVRTITRLIGDLHEKLPDGVQGFTNRTRSARRRMQTIQRMRAAP